MIALPPTWTQCTRLGDFEKGLALGKRVDAISLQARQDYAKNFRS